MRTRLVLPILPAAGLTVLSAWISYGFTADYGAYEGGPLAYFGGGSLLFWPVVVLVGALTGGVPYRFGERRAALVAGVAMTIFAVVGIGVGSVLGTRARAAQLPTSPVCVADPSATPPEEVESIDELEDALAEIDHPVRFDALSAEASADHCQNAFAGGSADHWVAHYEAWLVEHGWQVTSTKTSTYDFLTATRGRFQIRIYIDDPGFRGLATLRIERL